VPATLRDVAHHARVSIRTVSNVVSGYAHVSEATRNQVERSIEVLDYRPNPAARTLRTGRAGVLALVVPEIDVPYFSELARSVIDAASREGFRVMIDQTGHDHNRERDLLTGKDRTMLVDGILFSPLVTKSELSQMRRASQVPLVLLGEHDFDGQYDHVAIDNEQAAFDAVSHLAAIGRHRIAAIGTQPNEQYTTPQLRSAGYVRALETAGIEPDPALMISATHYSRGDGYRATRALLDSPTPPDAIFCYSDLLAIGAMRAVHDTGRSVPDDVAVIGIDDIDEGRYALPSLSTVSLDTPFIAQKAIERITARLSNTDLAATQVLAPHAVVVRESTTGVDQERVTELS